MKLLVTGYKGQLGFDVVNEAHSRGIEAVGVDIDEMDITNAQQVNDVIKAGNYDAVVHCAAWTAVDKAEEPELLDTVRAVNATGTQNIVNVCKELDIPVMYFSTDYVFNGQGTTPWNEYDERHPLNVYGQTKYEGELAVEAYPKHFIIRIAWVFGKNGNNFIKTMLRLGKEKGAVSVVNDQIGNPTYTFDLAKLVVDMIQTDKYGIYHATNSGDFISWYDFACEIFKQAKMDDVKVTPVDSSAFPAKATRPKNSRMNQTELDKNGFNRLPAWQDALARYLKEIRTE
ncbi:dTDP-4-dehydrorhamnose reductase [Faecalicoccus acidiformans]|uniref:dTDP-4-dehydrorhamnose reductase n=1 Tax=Faecalicoccus acidiformans TaxID=915173 RepID=A0A7W8FWU9_9FIRM|nr:dTDP-4-dehydrorhamnose reductase [Faecalicoccus acidiformans]MBB5185019.1 dTDP-4-dehydrorhamnose reductase [Faecalicoccus acidiformans]